MEISDFCAKIKRRREQLLLTQEDLALRLSLSRQAISKWERGESLPDITQFCRLATLLGMSLEELAGHTTTPPHPSSPIFHQLSSNEISLFLNYFTLHELPANHLLFEPTSKNMGVIFWITKGEISFASEGTVSGEIVSRIAPPLFAELSWFSASFPKTRARTSVGTQVYILSKLKLTEFRYNYPLLANTIYHNLISFLTLHPATELIATL